MCPQEMLKLILMIVKVVKHLYTIAELSSRYWNFSELTRKKKKAIFWPLSTQHGLVTTGKPRMSALDQMSRIPDKSPTYPNCSTPYLLSFLIVVIIQISLSQYLCSSSSSIQTTSTTQPTVHGDAQKLLFHISITRQSCYYINSVDSNKTKSTFRLFPLIIPLTGPTFLTLYHNTLLHYHYTPHSPQKQSNTCSSQLTSLPRQQTTKKKTILC